MERFLIKKGAQAKARGRGSGDDGSTEKKRRAVAFPS